MELQCYEWKTALLSPLFSPSGTSRLQISYLVSMHFPILRLSCTYCSNTVYWLYTANTGVRWTRLNPHSAKQSPGRARPPVLIWFPNGDPGQAGVPDWGQDESIMAARHLGTLLSECAAGRMCPYWRNLSGIGYWCITHCKFQGQAELRGLSIKTNCLCGEERRGESGRERTGAEEWRDH